MKNVVVDKSRFDALCVGVLEVRVLRILAVEKEMILV